MEKLAELDRVGEELVRKIGGMWVKLRGRLFDAGAGARLKPIIEVEDARPYVLLVVPPVSLSTLSSIYSLHSPNYISGSELSTVGVYAPLRRCVGDQSALLPHIREPTPRDQGCKLLL